MKKAGLLVLMLIIAISARSEKKRITLEDLFRDEAFTARTVSGMASMKDGEHFTLLDRQGRITKYNYSEGTRVEVLFDAATLDTPELKNINSYALSADENKILLTTNVIPIYRHSVTATYFIYDIKGKTLKRLSDQGGQMLACFSPDGEKVAFVRDNNIFIKYLAEDLEKQITFDGRFNHIINGAADWVHEEEFVLTTGFRWSPDSRRIAFYRFDESQVKIFNMPLFQNKLYPPFLSFKYPKAGETNAQVSIHVYDLESGSTAKMATGAESNQYIASIKWTANPARLSMVRLNRLQNKLDILVADATTGTSSILYSERDSCYINVNEENFPVYTPDGKYFIITAGTDGYNHLYLYGMDGKLVRQLTRGTNEVKAVIGYDEKRERVYFTGFDGSPLRTAVFYASVNGHRNGKLSLHQGTNSAVFSKGYKYFVHIHSSVQNPSQVTLHDGEGRQLRVLEDNFKLRELLAGYDIPVKEFFTFTTSEGIELNGYMVKPLDFNPVKRYPVMMYQYSGPGSQSVVDRFGIGWDHYLATEGYLVVCVDGRGTGGRGVQFEKVTYGQLGYYESTDQVEAARYLQTLSYVDPANIGIWGWSYGGYMSSLCLFKAPEVFSMAIAVAPVTTWRYYNTIYTERYMGLPQDNPRGYDDNSPINHVKGLQGKFLLVHGSADDNVHLQNTAELAHKLIEANKQFDIMIYPDKNHSIRGENTRLHLYTLMSNFIKKSQVESPQL